jgi:hypothetical protein
MCSRDRGAAGIDQPKTHRRSHTHPLGWSICKHKDGEASGGGK